MQLLISSIVLTLLTGYFTFGLIKILIKGSFFQNWWKNKWLLIIGTIITSLVILYSLWCLISAVHIAKSITVRCLLINMAILTMGIGALNIFFVKQLKDGAYEAHEPNMGVLITEIIYMGGLTLFGFISAIIEITKWFSTI